jgi:hypothetical protein
VSFHAFAAAFASVDYTEPSDIAMGAANVTFSLDDVLHADSSTLPLGTPGTFLITSHIEGNESCDNAAAGAQMHSSFLPIIRSPDCANGPFQLTTSTTFTVNVGQSTPIVLSFIVGASAFAGTSLGAGAVMDASNTGFVTIQSLTPGVTFSTDSGALFTDPTAPEPTPLFLMSVPLFALLTRVFSRR